MECDPSIKAIIEKIDSENGHDFIIENLGEELVMIKEARLKELQMKLDQVESNIECLARDDDSLTSTIHRC